MMNKARILLATCLVATAPSHAACPAGSPDRDESDSWDALATEILDYGSLRDTGFAVGRQSVYRLRPDGEGGDALLGRLRRLAPRIEALQAEISSDPSRAVVLMESRTGGFGESLAFTYCADAGSTHWLEDTFSDMGALPEGACMIVMFPERLSSSRLTDFALAHEWMHTMQTDAYEGSIDGDDWWREGSADWFAQKLVPGTTERDPVIDRFFSRQPECELPEHSYDAQIFYFWGEASFDARWVFEQGLDGQDWLRETARAAQTLPPGRWLDWAVAQADGDISFPDGRPLPSGPEVEPVEIGKACKATVTGPALSATFREVTLADRVPGPLRVEAGSSQVAIRGAGGDWTRLTGNEVIDPAPPSPFTLAAISPSSESLDVNLTTGPPDVGECGCYVGSWMELESAENDEPFRFRSGMAKYIAMVPGASMNYDTEGPVLTIAGDGRVTVDNPHSINFPEATIRYSTYRTYGTWEAEDDAIAFDLEGKHIEAQVSSEALSGFLDAPDASTLGVGGKWIPTCEGNRLTLSTWMFNPSDPPNEIHHFVRAE